MDYGDILSYIEHIIAGIEFEEIDLLEVKTKLEELTIDLEETIETSNRVDGEFDFDDLF